MQIEYRRGDLLDSVESVIIHGCNAQGVMGAGVAKAIRDRLPFAFAAYRMAHHRSGGKLRLGDVIWAVNIHYGERSRLVGNGITQEYWHASREARLVDYDAVRAVMREVDRVVALTQSGDLVLPDVSPVGAVGMPMIGAGLGGGDWAELSQIIEGESHHFVPVVYQR
jgi:O-acetyl-ADP-ribose deacetylase (regulator of RNase III)